MEPQLIKIIDYNYTLVCRLCTSKVIDPDKKKNQVYLDGRCPSCGGNSVVPKSKKQRKRERKAQQRALAKLLKGLA
jgi:rRNA maturation endonuclease Nob1